MDDDLEQKINRKFIRNVIKPLEQINRYNEPTTPYQIPSASELFQRYPPTGSQIPFEPSLYTSRPPLTSPLVSEHRAPLPSSPVVSLPQPPVPVPPTPLNCVTVCGHVKACPVCSQLYRPYIGVYLTVIVILVIIILFLAKKLFRF